MDRVEPVRRSTRLGATAVFVVITVALGVEVLLRAAGFEAYRPIEQDVESTPSGCLVPHPELGFGLGAGRFSVRVRDDLLFTSTQTREGYRITRRGQQTILGDPRPVVLITGGSFSYGYGVEDEESYPFLVQNRIGDRQIVNAAVPGHGTLQAILQLQALEEIGVVPERLVVGYLDFHDARNALAPSYGQLLRDVFLAEGGAAGAIAGDARQAARHAHFPRLADGELQLVPVTELHHDAPGRGWSATVNAVENVFVQRRDHDAVDDHVTERALALLSRACDARGVQLVLALLDDSPRAKALQRFAAARGIESLDLSVDYDDPRYTNLPHDWHPSALAHRRYADVVARYLAATSERIATSTAVR